MVPKTAYAWDGSGLGGIGDEAGFAAGAAGAEDACWLLCMIADHREGEGGEGRSSLVVLDGADLSAGPVARIWLKHRIPHGLHGMFVSGGGGAAAAR